MHGFVSVISELTGKVIDRIHMCSECVVCKVGEKKDHKSLEYLEWFNSHEPNCLLNHKGSPQSMESVGAVELFRRSIRKYGLRYKTFIGDGDSKSYNSVVKSAPYGPIFITEKEECTGHIQKRMGTRLRSVVSRHKGK